MRPLGSSRPPGSVQSIQQLVEARRERSFRADSPTELAERGRSPLRYDAAKDPTEAVRASVDSAGQAESMVKQSLADLRSRLD